MPAETPSPDRVSFCAWCPDPRHPLAAAHPDGGPEHRGPREPHPAFPVVDRTAGGDGRVVGWGRLTGDGSGCGEITLDAEAARRFAAAPSPVRLLPDGPPGWEKEVRPPDGLRPFPPDGHPPFVMRTLGVGLAGLPANTPAVLPMSEWLGPPPESKAGMMADIGFPDAMDAPPAARHTSVRPGPGEPMRKMMGVSEGVEPPLQLNYVRRRVEDTYTLPGETFCEPCGGSGRVHVYVMPDEPARTVSDSVPETALFEVRPAVCGNCEGKGYTLTYAAARQVHGPAPRGMPAVSPAMHHRVHEAVEKVFIGGPTNLVYDPDAPNLCRPARPGDAGYREPQADTPTVIEPPKDKQ